MMRGRDLVEAYLGKTKHVLTTQLLEGLDGRKMSKTYGNTVDLNEDPVPMFFKLTLDPGLQAAPLHAGPHRPRGRRDMPPSRSAPRPSTT